ncbi:MAG: ABC transporter permease [Spirochaetaceae bacterium]|nr:ABC transporter permease [Spirochaetaceae bacterium]
MNKYLKNRNFIIGFIFLSIILILAFGGLFFKPYNPSQIDIANKLQGFSRQHILGTDHLGRDILSRLMVGSTISLEIGFFVVLFGALIGIPIGAIAGYYGGKIDEIIMKLIDTLMSFPGVLIALMLIAVFNVSLSIIILALVLIALPKFARISRSGFYKYRESPFVLATKARGASSFRIMLFHILPHLVPSLMVTASLTFATAIISEAGLSYLGLGIQPPTPSFGKMVSEAQSYILQDPLYVFIPTLAITILVLGFNLIGDGIQDISEKDKNNE